MKSVSPLLPLRLRTILGGCTRELVVTGETSARVERYTTPARAVLFLKADKIGGAHPLEDEIVRLEWMASMALPVPRIVTHLVHDDIQYLVTEALPGTDASQPRPDGSQRAVVAALAGALRRLHSTPVHECPFRHDAAARVHDASSRVRAGQVNSGDFDAGRAGRSSGEVFQELVAAHEMLVAKRAAGEAPPEGAVFTHGDYCFPNVILRQSSAEPRGTTAEGGLALSGFVDCGRAGVADPYQDLALCARSVVRNLGAQWVPVFFADYGLSVVDQERIDFYTLLDEFF